VSSPIFRSIGGHSSRRRTASAIALAAVLLAVVVVVSGFTTRKQADTIKIALVGPTTGVFAPSTVGFNNSLETRIAQVNKRGGLFGKQLEFIVKDDGGQPNVTLQDVRELIDQGVHVIVTVTSASALALRPLMTGNMTFIHFTANPPVIQDDPTQMPWTFNFFPPNQLAVSRNTKIAKSKKWTKWAIVSDTTAQFQEYVDLTKKAAPGAGASIVLEQRYDPLTTDFSPVITKLKDTKPDVVYLFAAGAAGTRFYTAAASAGYTTPVLGGYGNAAADLTVIPASYLRGQIYFISTTPGLLTLRSKPYAPKYAALMNQVFYPKYGKKANIGGGVSWDMANGIIWAIQQAGSDDPQKMRDALEKTGIGHNNRVGFTSNQVTYGFTKDWHGGYPPSGVKAARLYGSSDWPGFYYIAPVAQ
jgi:branched-chain amino acid transport system substrate-binding protein